MALYILYVISWENACLVHMGFPKPYMVYEKGSNEYIDQLNSYANPEGLLNSLGNLYDVYDFDRFFHFIRYFGPDYVEDKFKWINF